jgi:hypothetical protein
MDFADFASNISFRLLQPDVARGEDRRFVFERESGESARLLELPYAPVDFFNTRLPERDGELRAAVRQLCDAPRMSTFGIAGLINQAVASMPAGSAYVNVGVWMGFTFLSGMVGNPGALCIGVDNFSEFGGPRDAFMERFERHRGPAHQFHEMDYRKYFNHQHADAPIGVYYYDGHHSYDQQMLGLQVAEPYFVDGCIVFVDDTNWPQPHRATYDFLEQSDRSYRLLLDRSTAGNGHPTYWNGLMLLQVLPERSGDRGGHAVPERAPRSRLPEYGRVPIEPSSPLVSVVLHNEHGDAARLEAALEAAAAQTWPSLEVIVADESASEECREVIAAADGRVSALSSDEPPGRTLLQQSIDVSRGEFIAFADCESPLRPSAVSIGLGYPRFAQFNGHQAPAGYQQFERALVLREEIASVVPPGGTYAIAKARLKMPALDDSRRSVPFFEDDDQGTPPDAEAAIATVEQHRSTGIRWIAFAWTSFEWLREYGELRSHLKTTARPVLENDRVAIWELE